MKLTIQISKELAEHLSSPHTFWDECEPACVALRKLQKQIDKKLPKKKNETFLQRYRNRKKPYFIKFRTSSGGIVKYKASRGRHNDY